ncbi:MAG: hypothetical protein RL637_1520 [Pseudomonadota bacterium]|jgi:hydroxymethylbilane synthase
MTSIHTLRIATRKSPLALWQAEHVAHCLRQIMPELKIELVTMVTQGDKILDTPLAKIGGKGLFIKELEQGILAGEADIAVHSMKDVTMEFPAELQLAAILPREDPSDALVSNRYLNLETLPENAKIGTSSLRRQCQLQAYLPNAHILPLRGNVNTRLAKLDAGDYDAIILATAGLKRLGLEARIRQKLPSTISLPAVGQGAIGIEARIDHIEINELLQKLHHQPTAICVQAERAMNAHLKGGCQVPIAGFAQLIDDTLTMQGLVGQPNGKLIYRASRSGLTTQAKEIGIAIAEDLLSQGADKILQDLYSE